MVFADHMTEQIVARVLRRMRPLRIVLFGSRAKGQARLDSDYDLLVIAHSDQPRYRRSAPLYAELADLPLEVDALVYTPDEVAAWQNVSESLVSTAIREGIVLYEGQG